MTTGVDTCGIESLVSVLSSLSSLSGLSLGFSFVWSFSSVESLVPSVVESSSLVPS